MIFLGFSRNMNLCLMAHLACKYPHKHFHIELEPDHMYTGTRATLPSSARTLEGFPQIAESPRKIGNA